MSARWPPRHEKRIFDVFYDVILFLETTGTYRNRFWVTHAASALTAALSSAVLYTTSTGLDCVIRSLDELVFTSYVWQGVVLIVLFVVMAAYVDTAMTMCSALIVDVTCPSTVTRTLVSAVSRVPRN